MIVPRSPFWHFFLCTVHFLVSFVGGHRLPFAEGCCIISRTRVSVPLLKPHVFPFFVHGLQGFHSLTSQCTETEQKKQTQLAPNHFHYRWVKKKNLLQSKLAQIWAEILQIKVGQDDLHIKTREWERQKWNVFSLVLIIR